MAKLNSSSKRRISKARGKAGPLKVQKDINEDYLELGRDYQKLGMALWRRPATRYVLYGVGVGFITPFILKSLMRVPMVNEFFESSFSTIKDKWASITEESGLERTH